jgi:hypothetical protein
MNQRLFFLLAAFSLSAISTLALAAWRRPYRILLLLAAFGINASAQTQIWSTLLDNTRAVNWTSAGFTIPSYTTNCPTQPTLATGSGAASANATSIQNALNSCTSTQNVVNIPAGTWYVGGILYGTQGKQVLRGAGPNSTDVIFTGGNGCALGLSEGICMRDSNGWYNGSAQVLPGGSNQCSWTGGLAQGSTSITLSGCGGAPPVNQTIILDQANDTSDTSGVYICDVNIGNCGYESSNGGNNDGRSIGGKTYSQQQVTYVTGVTSLGGGSYTVTISPGVYFTNIRSSQSPGAWWPGFVQNDGLENMTIDGSNLSDSTLGMYDCYQCWVKNVRSLNAGRNHVALYQSADDVIRDSYFYSSQSHYSESYVVETEESSAFLVENNIFQQVTNPLMFGAGSGAVVGYNFSIDDIYSGANQWMAAAYSVHNAGNEMNLWEGNNFVGIWSDDAWGSSSQQTYFRNMLIGWQNGDVNMTIPIMLRANDRAFSIIGNVLGQPGYHNQYQTYASSKTAGTGAAQESNSIYSLGWGGTGAVCSSGSVTSCDPLVYSTLVRWGNYDTVNGSVQWNATEASPIAVPYLNANFLTSYFSALAHTLPNSMYYNSAPTWWPSSKPWPPVGPDVTSGNLGLCTGGTYAGAQATAASQCTGGTLGSGWASHVNSIPAQDCYLSTMHGPPDGTGGELSFDASQCYTSSGTTGTGLGVPSGLTGSAVAK